MKFWDREKEKGELKAYLRSEPNAILFVYGPKSSGKSTLLSYVIDDLLSDESFKQSHQVYWFDLRERLISNYKDVVDIFFIDEEAAQETFESEKGFEANILSFFKVSVRKKKLLEDKRLDPFKYMTDKLRMDEKIGVIIFDEIQKLKDVYMNGKNQRPVVKELFNFFVRLTKVLHLSHVIVMSSDTFFMEEVYSDSTLKNTSRYYLVDFFDDETAEEILKEEGIGEKVSKEIVEKAGGVPWILEEVLESKEPLKVLDELYKETKAKILSYIDGKIIDGEDEGIVVKVFETVLNKEFPKSKEFLKEVRNLVDREILFYDPINRVIRFQTRLDEIAAKEVLSER